MPTKFALEKLPLAMPDGTEFTFWFDGNGKITFTNGTFDKPIANAFSLVQVQDCPFATPTCKNTCYVHGLEKQEAEVHRKYRENSRTIRRILDNPHYFKKTVSAFSTWISEHCPGGFRWHVSGDIFSIKYARFIRKVCDAAPDVKFVIYTRSFQYLTPLVGAKNLVINLSADKDNYKKARRVHRKYDFRICYLTVEGEVPEDLPKGSVIFPAYGLRGRDLPIPTQAPWWKSLTAEQKKMVCPPDFFGQSAHFRCGICRKCLS
ncbi:MAG: hypothetical protein HYV47_01820 [Candidatus Nealsonbacteria bacterium]|nr:hypothetical protein [Candidatus Nealsonbacteria bacterium]